MEKDKTICVSSSTSSDADSDTGPLEICENNSGCDSDTDSAEVECVDPPASSESRVSTVPPRDDSFYRLTPRSSSVFPNRRVTKMTFANAKLSSGSAVSNVGGLIEDGGVHSMLLAFLSPPHATDNDVLSTPAAFKGCHKGEVPKTRLKALPIVSGLTGVGSVSTPTGVPVNVRKTVRVPASPSPSPMTGLTGIAAEEGLADPASTDAEGGFINTKAVSTRDTAKTASTIARRSTALEWGVTRMRMKALSRPPSPMAGLSGVTTDGEGVVGPTAESGSPPPRALVSASTSTAAVNERGASPQRNVSCKNAAIPSPLSRDGDEEEEVVSLSTSPILTLSTSSREYIPKEYSVEGSSDDPVKKALYDLHVLMTEGINDENDRSHLREVHSGSLYEHTVYFVASASGHKVRSELASKISVDVCFRSNLIENILILSIRKAKTIELERIKEIDKNARVVHPSFNYRTTSLVENNTSPHPSLRNNGHFTRLSELTNKYLKNASVPVNMFTNLKYFLCRCGVMMTDEVKCASIPHVLVYDNLLVRMGLSKDSASRAVRRYKKALGNYPSVTMTKYIHEDTIDGKRVLNPLSGHEFGKKDECVSVPIDLFLVVLYDTEVKKGLALCHHVSSFSRALSFDMIARHFIGRNVSEKDSGPSAHDEKRQLERHAKEMADLRNEMEKQNDIRIKEIKAKYEEEHEKEVILLNRCKKRLLKAKADLNSAKNAVRISAEKVGDLQWSIDKEIAEHKHTKSSMEEIREYAKEKEDYANALATRNEELTNKLKNRRMEPIRSLVITLENAWEKASSLLSSYGDDGVDEDGEGERSMGAEEHSGRKRKRDGGEGEERKRKRKERKRKGYTVGDVGAGAADEGAAAADGAGAAADGDTAAAADAADEDTAGAAADGDISKTGFAVQGAVIPSLPITGDAK